MIRVTHRLFGHFGQEKIKKVRRESAPLEIPKNSARNLQFLTNFDQVDIVNAVGFGNVFNTARES